MDETFALVSAAYRDPEIKATPALRGILLKYSVALQTGKTYGYVCQGLNTEVSKYVHDYRYQLPQSMVQLMHQINGD